MEIKLHWMPMDITDDHLGAFAVLVGSVTDVSSIVSKSGLVSGDHERHVTFTEGNSMAR